MRIALYLVVVCFLLSCSFININLEPIAATITQFSTCDASGEEKHVFTPDERRIFICGQLQTLSPVDLTIYWYYEDELAFQQFGEDAEDGSFYNFVEPAKGGVFPEGNYRVEVLIEGTLAESTEFRVEKP